MIPWVWVPVAFVGGAILGVFLTALISAGGDDRE